MTWRCTWNKFWIAIAVLATILLALMLLPAPQLPYLDHRLDIFGN